MAIDKIEFGSRVSSKELNKIFDQIDGHLYDMTIDNFNGFSISEQLQSNGILVYDPDQNEFVLRNIDRKSISKVFSINDNFIKGFPQNNNSIFIFNEKTQNFEFYVLDFEDLRNHTEILGKPINYEDVIKEYYVLVFQNGEWKPKPYIYNNLDHDEWPASGLVIQNQYEYYKSKANELERGLNQLSDKLFAILRDDLPMYLTFDPFIYVDPPQPNFKIKNISSDTIDANETGQISVTVKNEGNFEHEFPLTVEIPGLDVIRQEQVSLTAKGGNNDEVTLSFTIPTSYSDNGTYDIQAQIQNDESVNSNGFEVNYVAPARFIPEDLNNQTKVY